MKCPRCQSPLPAPVRLNAEGFLVCPACGSKLRARSGPPAAAPAPEPQPDEPSESDNPLAALAGLSSPQAEPVEAPAPGSGLEPSAAPPPAPAAGPKPAPGPTSRTPDTAAGYEAILAELKDIRRSQDRLLDLLTSGARPASGAGPVARAQAPSNVRTLNRKTVLIIDDDLAARAELADALREAEVPLREAGSGNEGLTLISQERPDVIVIEADLGGDMSSQDTITLIKATMEWIDIPIVLYTHRNIVDEDEARTAYAADGFVIKGQGAAATLVGRIVALFRR